MDLNIWSIYMLSIRNCLDIKRERVWKMCNLLWICQVNTQVEQRVLDGKLRFNKTTWGTEIEQFITHRSWRKYPAHREGPHGEIMTESDKERQDLGYIPLWGSIDSVLCWAKAGLVSSIQKSRVSVCYLGILSKGCIWRRQWEAGETADHKGCWGSHMWLTFACDSMGVHLHEGSSIISLRSLQAFWLNKMDVIMPWSSLVKLLIQPYRKKWTKTLNWIFSEEDIQTNNKLIKDAQHH